MPDFLPDKIAQSNTVLVIGDGFGAMADDSPYSPRPVTKIGILSSAFKRGIKADRQEQSPADQGDLTAQNHSHPFAHLHLAPPPFCALPIGRRRGEGAQFGLQ